MFWLSLLWLGLVGAMLHLLADEGRRFDSLAWTCGVATLVLWPLFAIELVAHWIARGRRIRRHCWILLFPALRLGARDHVDGTTLWLPVLGWMEATDNLEHRLEKALSVPMIAVALLVLPVIAIETIARERVASEPPLALATQLAGAFIWLAFAVEFIVMASIVARPFTYVRKHWLDLAIIILPVIAFLRVLRVGRLGRLLRLNQLSRLSRTARAFRMRGLALRVWRALLLLEVVDRLIHRDLDKKLAKLESQLLEKEAEVEQLRELIEQLRRKIETTEPCSPR